MRIEFRQDGGANFIIYEHNEDGTDNREKPLASDMMPWIEVLRVGNEMVNRAKAMLANQMQLGNVSVVGRATVSDPPPKEQPHDGEAGS
jgi:hypothetical protein